MPARVLVVGLDAADPALLRDLAGRGELPTVAGLLEESPPRSVTNPDGLFVGAVWPTLWTGASPGHHGRWWPGRFQPGTYQIRPNEASAIGVEPLWLPLARAGRRVAVIDAPHAPTASLPGLTQLTDWGGHDVSEGFTASSSRLADDVEARFGRHPVDACDRYAADGELERLVADLRVGLDRKTELSCALLDETEWDLFFTVFSEAHCVGHQCWHLHDRDHPAHDPARAGVLDDPVVDVYRRLDRAAAELLDRVDEGCEVFVVASHGMGPHHDATFLLTRFLRRLETTWGREPTPWARGHDRLRHAWNRVARRVGLRPRRTWMLDSARAFFPFPNAGPCAAIRLNVAGREPAGTVRPGTEYEELCAALEVELLALVNVETGEAAVRRVLRPAEIFDGPAVDRMPDLIAEWRQEHPFRSIASPSIGRLDGASPGHRTGDHRRDGLLLRRGPTAPTDGVTTIDARAFAPDVCALLGVGSLAVPE